MVTNQQLPGLRIVGLSGGIGAGKSTVAKYLSDSLPKPVLVLSADDEVGELLNSAEVSVQVAEVLGNHLLGPDGLLDRSAVAGHIFSDEKARKTLEGLLHPAVRSSIFNKLSALEQSGGAVWALLDVPLMHENGLDRACDFEIFVEVSAAERCRRACQRHGWEENEWKSREKAQLPLEKKQQAADAMVHNEGALSSLPEQLAPIVEQILSLAPRPLRDRWPA
ncbi:MAG: dephospho-CoA kinase [Planctomycetota bacterium]|nr:MAG: dephospho-CoA kinase [Planctomycetota bacterium]